MFLLQPDEPKKSPKRADGRATPGRAIKKYLALLSTAPGIPPTTLAAVDDYKTALLWSNDSKHLFRIARKYKNSTQIEVRFFDYSLASKAETQIASLTYQDEDKREEDPTEPLFYPLGVSQDDKNLFFVVNQNTGKTQNGRLLFDESLETVNLQTDKIGVICRVPESGMDWHDDSSAILAHK